MVWVPVQKLEKTNATAQAVRQRKRTLLSSPRFCCIGPQGIGWCPPSLERTLWFTYFTDSNSNHFQKHSHRHTPKSCLARYLVICDSGGHIKWTTTLHKPGSVRKLKKKSTKASFELPWCFSSENSACSAGDAGLIPGSGRSPGKEMAIHCSILAWKIPWPEEPGGVESMGLQRVGHNLAASLLSC